MTVTVIAEFGSSPMPEWDVTRYCAAAALAGADAAKIQLFYVDELYPEDQRAAMRGRDFPRERLAEFVNAAHLCGLEAGASVFDWPAVALGAARCDWIKLAASQQLNRDLMNRCFETGKLRYRTVANLGFAQFSVASFLHGPLALTFNTIPKYPAALGESLLAVTRAAWWFKRFGLLWGWSSHCLSPLDKVLAVLLGARAIEAHFALSPDDCEAPHSLQPEQFSQMVKSIRRYERN